MANQTKNMSLRGSLSIFFSASVWGLFWIPLHYFDSNGLQALWAVTAINFAGLIIAVPAMLLSDEKPGKHLKWLIVIGVGMGASNILYFTAMILTEVVRAVFLFYLLPLWATLFSWAIFGETIGRARLLALGVAVLGIWLLLGAGGWPIPKNLGDVFALLSGAGWAFGLTMIRGRSGLGALSTTVSGLFFAFAGAAVLGIVLSGVLPELQPAFPNSTVIHHLVLPVLAFGILVLWPTLFGQFWGAQHVAATVAALLTMSEILVATVSTTLMGEAGMSLVSWFGAGLILLAIFVDLFGDANA